MTKIKKEAKVYTIKVNLSKRNRRKQQELKKENAENKAKVVLTVNNRKPKYPGKAPIPEEHLEKHSRGSGVEKSGVKTGVYKKKFEKRERILKYAHEQAATTEILLTEDAGYLEADAGETTRQFTQAQIVKNVDISAATKSFELNLHQFGPYRSKYTKNGRHLLLGGKKGHVAAFDWVTKKLHCEFNVMESVHDVSWLHIETMMAVAQKDWVYIYDNEGIELHCIKRMNKVSRMEFLPYHFLLAAASDEGYLSWLDVSIGELVGQYNTRLGKLNMLTQNPWNAVLCLGHSKGVVSMWAPNSREPLAKMLCHKAPMTALHVDPSGTYMATAATNREVRIWDIRQLEGPLQTYKLPTVVGNLAFSQKNMLAMSMGNIVDVYRDCTYATATKAYLRHRFSSQVGNMNFCPFEDVLGVASDKGFTSLLIPGCGEANFDGYEANPYQVKSQRREAEVKALLEKIQPDLISLDPSKIAEVNVPSLKDKIEAKEKLLHVKAPKIDYNPRKKAKGKGGTVKIAKNKKIVNEQAKKEFVKTLKKTDGLLPVKKPQKKQPTADFGILNRFT